MLSPLASASLVFLTLYFCIFIILFTLLSLKKVPWRSRWLVLLLHVLCRLASQACGITFGVIGYRNIDVLVAYYILGAEGYFTLVVCTARFLIAWQRDHWNGYSWIEPVNPSQERAGWKKRFKGLFQWRKSNEDQTRGAGIAIAVDWLLVAANAIIVAGGSLNSAAYRDKDLSSKQVRSKLHACRAMRAAGQSVFLAINTALLVCIAVSIHQYRHGRYEDPITTADNGTPSEEKSQAGTTRDFRRRPWYGHTILLLLLMTWPFLAVRGIFGICQGLLPDLNVSTPLQCTDPRTDIQTCSHKNLLSSGRY